jgi:acyl-CoA synthetase (AMP-forming)/AMP-acid ligase II/thioesterase domain-containing protein/aryl carrier-like protein
MYLAGPDDSSALCGAGGETWSYRHLRSTTHRLSRGILEAISAPRVRIALICQPGPEAILYTLAIWRAGCVAVPLDPFAPVDRLQQLIGFAQPDLILSDRTLPAELGPILRTEGLQEGPESSAELPESPFDGLATLIFTSGSTGRPKGVLQTHQNFRALGEQFAEALSLDSSDRVSGLFPHYFSASVLDLVSTLGRSATLVHNVLDADSLASLWSWLVSEEITILHTLPSVLRVILSQAGRQTYALKSIDLAGEPLTRDDIRRTQEVFPQAKILNHLALSELSVTALFPVTEEFEGTTVPVGYPAPTTELLIEEGEILISSPYLTPGYWAEPNLEAQRFIFKDGRRFLRTGDHGHLDSEGRLHYLGRDQGRVRVNGQNVDLLEIEAILRRHPGIVDALVRQERGLLQAYCLPGERIPKTDQLRKFLQAQLPQAHVPARFHLVSQLPKTSTGKVQRLQIRPPETKTPPETEEEEILCGLLRRQLGLKEVGIDDSLLELGLDSLGAAQLQTTLKRGGYQVKALDILETHSIKTLAPLMKGCLEEDKKFHLFYDGGGEKTLVFFHNGVGVSRYRDLLCRELKSAGRCYRQAPVRGQYPSTIQEYAQRYVDEAAALGAQEPVFLVGFSFGGLLAYEVGCQLEKRGKRVQGLFLIDPVLKKPTPHDLLREHWKNLSWAERLKLFTWGLLQRVRELAATLYTASGLDLGLWFWQKVYFTHSRARSRTYQPSPTSLPMFVVENEEAVGADFGKLADGEIAVHRICAEHVALVAKPHLSTIAELLENVLTGANRKPETDRERV